VSGGGGTTTHAVTYTVSGGDGAGTITYENENADTSQATQVATPWTYTFTAVDGAFLYVSAQNAGGGTITCSISVDGTIAESNKSEGQYAICEASGSL
jgi:hypothetical protein